MAFPNHTEIEATANQLDFDPIAVFAYAALHGRLPTDRSELLSLQTTVQNSGFFGNFGEPISVRYGYIQANGAILPSSSWPVYRDWAVQHGYLHQSASGQHFPTGAVPTPGLGYPPGGAAINPPAGAGEPAAPVVPAGGFDVGSLLRPPTVYLVGGAAALLLLGRRR